MDKKKLYALTVLGKNFFLHIFKKYLLGKKSAGMNDFIEYYRDDRIVSLSGEERELFPQFSKCISCELCEPVCPVLSEAGRNVFAGPMDIANCLSRDLTESGDLPDPFLSTLCGACEQACPEKVPVCESIIYLRRKSAMTNPDKLPEFYKTALGNLQRHSCVFDKKVSSLGEKKSDMLYWRGCRDAQWGTLHNVKLLNFLGVEIMTIEEGCCGGLPSDLGLQYDPGEIYKRIEKTGASTIVASCGVCASKLAKAFPDKKIKTATEMLYETQLPAKGQLAGKKIVFHDPCRQRPKDGNWEKPRDVIRKLGGIVVPMEREKADSVCCGAGGGLYEVKPELAKAIAAKRIGEAISAGADMLITSCDLCAKNLAAALKESDKIEVKTLVEAVLL